MLEDVLIEPDCELEELGSLHADDSESLEVLRVGIREARLGWSRPVGRFFPKANSSCRTRCMT